MTFVRLVSNLKWRYTGMTEETMEDNRSMTLSCTPQEDLHCLKGGLSSAHAIYLFIYLSGSEPSRFPKVILLKVDWDWMLFIILNLVFNYNIGIDNLGKLINKLGRASRLRYRSVKSVHLAYTVSQVQFSAQNSWPFHTFNHLFLTSICFRW